MNGPVKIWISVITLTLMTFCQNANAATFMNGSFELGTNPGSSTQLNAGSTDITGWTVGGNSIDYVGNYWVAQDGARSIDLTGIGAGNLAQTFDTVIGRRYTVTFYLAGNPDAGPLVKTLRTSATGNAAQIDHFDATNSTHANLGWIPITYDFTATAASTTLQFSSLNEGKAGPALDRISVTGVPEAGTWAMMLGGFGMIGSALRGRRRETGDRRGRAIRSGAMDDPQAAGLTARTIA